jgi:prepilin-type N-terminal cleavage/methylation domain-containing protein
MRPCRQPRSTGFTLIEVSLATAVAAVAVMGLMVVMMAATGLSRKASDQTLQGMLAQQLFAEIRACDFNSVTLKNASGASVGTVNLKNVTTKTTLGELYFDPDGVRVDAGPQYFKCAIKFGPLLDLTGQVVYAELQFVEPAHTINPVITNTFYTRISRYW